MTIGSPRDGAVVDLRSDTVTVPTPEMRAAIAAAEVGDDVYGEDPTVNRLESLTAALLGKEASLFVPTGTMGNQLALRVLAGSGTTVVSGERSHIVNYEPLGERGAGVDLVRLDDSGGTLGPDTVASQLAELGSVRAVTIENTHMAASGRPWVDNELAAVSGVCRDAGVVLHMDGARIWNAAIATGRTPAEIAAHADTVMCCLSKGLGAPVGSLLSGPADVIAEARLQRHDMGGAMRQAGVIAAAGVVAIETMVERLAEDHDRARRLAEHLADRFPGSIDPAAVATNIVCTVAEALPGDVLERLAAGGVKAGMVGDDTVRFVTHKDVDDDGLTHACAVLDDMAGARQLSG
ncbi:MAG: threonine aldolase family protein [Acidimicrobiia bacterium]